MPKNSGQKKRLLLVMKILQQETDSCHTITLKELGEKLTRSGIRFDRKSIYADLEELRTIGIDTGLTKGRHFGYYWTNRPFELAELKILIDAVQSSRYLTERKSRSLIGKLEDLGSIHEAKRLDEQVCCDGRIKAPNELIYQAISLLCDAIARDRQVTFKYFEYTMTKTMRYRRNGHIYQVSPYTLHQDHDYYYLICHNPERGLVHFRVDKIADIEILSDLRQPMPDNLDLVHYTRQSISMFGGQLTRVTMQFATSLIGVVIDRFGRDFDIRPTGDGWFETDLDVQISPTFLAWVFQLGCQARIVAPDDIVRLMAGKTAEVAALYPSAAGLV